MKTYVEMEYAVDRGDFRRGEELAGRMTGIREEITAIDEGRSITYDLRFERPMKNTAVAKFEVTPTGSGTTQVTWSFDSPSKFPMSLFAPIFRNMLGKDMIKGLGNLKAILE